jgi:hypothetical protein
MFVLNMKKLRQIECSNVSGITVRTLYINFGSINLGKVRISYVMLG